MKKITLTLFLMLISLFILNNNVHAKSSSNLVNIYFFHSNTCSHCKEESKYLNKLEKRYKNIKIYKYEVHDQNNHQLLKELETLYNIKINSVPLTIIGNKVYTGYSEKSQIIFIKTIEYFSKYSYEDKLGKYLEIDIQPSNINNSDISLEDFVENYQNYNLFGLKTDDLDTSSIDFVLGVLSCFNIFSIIGMILTLIVLHIMKINNKMLILTLYTILNSILLLITLLNNYIINLIAFIFLIIIFIYILMNKSKKNKKYLIFNIVIIISLIICILIRIYDNGYILIFKNLLQLHGLTGISKILYYINYLTVNLIINFLLIYIVYLIIKKISTLF